VCFEENLGFAAEVVWSAAIGFHLKFAAEIELFAAN
jgi:hypothetical protein